MILRDVPADMIDKADAIGHRTVWLNGNDKAFIFITWDPDNMARAKAALEAADCLCDTDLGPVPE